jgi:hypothetical protein
MGDFNKLQILIAELSKDQPHPNTVKKYMLMNGLEYTADPIAQMTVVLELMSKISPDMQKSKSKERATEL